MNYVLIPKCQGAAAKGRLSKEDAARICVEALDAVPPKGLVFEVS